MADFYSNNSTNGSGHEFEFWRHPVHLLIIYFAAYILVFTVGLIGNLFVIMAVALNASMRVITNYFITSLAVADLLVIIFCVPASLMNNVVNEWYFGGLLCKLSVWINGTAVCASIYTLVAVSADRYFAICHTMRYSTLEPKKTLIIIIPIWIASGILFLPYLFYFNLLYYPIDEVLTVRICISQFPSEHEARLYFMTVNFAIAFIIPLFAIIACYIYIYGTIAQRPTLAVDKNAQARDQRVKLKVTHMMVTVVITFAASWFPFYCFFAYVMYNPKTENDVTVVIFRPILMWLSLANSCINPILYAYFSRKFRRAFREILILPCRKRYNQLKTYTQTTRRRTARIRSQITDNVLARVAMLGASNSGRFPTDESTCYRSETTNPNETTTTEIRKNSKKHLINTARMMQSRLGSEMNLRKEISSLSLLKTTNGKDLTTPVIRNSEVISESSSEGDVIEPGMIALSLITLPILVTSIRKGEETATTLREIATKKFSSTITMPTPTSPIENGGLLSPGSGVCRDPDESPPRVTLV